MHLQAPADHLLLSNEFLYFYYQKIDCILLILIQDDRVATMDHLLFVVILLDRNFYEIQHEFHDQIIVVQIMHRNMVHDNMEHLYAEKMN